MNPWRRSLPYDVLLLQLYRESSRCGGFRLSIVRNNRDGGLETVLADRQIPVDIGFLEAIADRADMATWVTETALDLISLTDTVRDFERRVVDSTELKQCDVWSVVENVVADLRHEYPDTEFSIEGNNLTTVMATGRETPIEHGSGLGL